MSMYNLIEYTSNYSKTTGSLWCHLKDEETNFNADIQDTNNLKSFNFTAKLLQNTVEDEANGILKNETIAVLLKYLNNFWRLLEMILNNCKVELKLKWTKYCVLSAAGNEMLIIIIMPMIFFYYQRDKIICLYCSFISKRQTKIIKKS